MFAKIEVNGSNTDPVYSFLRDNGPLKGGNIPWNFAKFLINEKGEVAGYHGKTNDYALSFKQEIEAML